MIKAGYVMIWDEGKIQYLHRWLFNLTTNDKSTHVDHISGDKLDCRRANLRLGSRSDNMCNIKKMMKPNLSSKFKGVSKSGQFYNAQITKDKVVYNLGKFKSEIMASLAYNKKARELHKDYAVLNEITLPDYKNELLNIIRQEHPDISKFLSRKICMNGL
jgi:hypothetical protein